MSQKAVAAVGIAMPTEPTALPSVWWWKFVNDIVGL